MTIENIDPLSIPAPAPAPEPELSAAELQTAVEALPVKGHVCVLTPRVEALEEKLLKLGAAFEALVPLLTAGKEFAERVDAIEKAVAELKALPASPAAHDARLQLLEGAVQGLSALAPAIEKHFGIKI